MENLFDNELKHNEFCVMLSERVSNYHLEIAPKIAILEGQQGREKRALSLRPVIRDLMRRLGVSVYKRDASRNKNGKVGYYVCRVFNGRFYDSYPIRWLNDFVVDWLTDFCRADADKYKNFSYVISTTVESMLLDRILSPRHTLMCFRNGVVDFKDMKLMPHSPEHHVVKMYDFNWNPEADCPLWKSFLGMPAYVGQKGVVGVLPEASKRAVLQKFLGASFIDRKKVRFEYFLILYGDGANGKSVIKDVLEGIFGKEEVLPNLDLGQLTRMGDEKLRAMDSMDGKRISYCTELNLGHLKQPEMLKILSSGESAVGRGIGENIRVIDDIPLIICNTNRKVNDKDSLPKDSPTDESVSRRLLLISFDKVLKENERNPEILQHLMKEKEGIFMWMVRGYKRLKNDKWKIEESMEGRIDKIRMSLNSSIPSGVGNKKISGSVSEWLKFKNMSPIYTDETPHEHMLLFDDMYVNYVKFCRKNGVAESVMATNQKFGRDMGILGYRKRNDIGKENHTGYLVYAAQGMKMALMASIPSIIEELNVDALLREARDEELEHDNSIND